MFLRKKQGDVIESDNRLWILIGAIFGAVLGSRLIGGLENPLLLSASANKWVYFYENKTVLGGFLGGLFGVEFVKKIIKEKHASGDLFTYPIILALIIGRIGCFSMGIYEETYGLPTKLPWGMHLGDNQLRHPVCLYEIIFLILSLVYHCKVRKKIHFAKRCKVQVVYDRLLSFSFPARFYKTAFIH